MIKLSRKPHSRTSKKLAYGTMTAYRHADRAAGSLGRWATTDHTGFSQSLSNMPKMGLMDSCRYIGTRFVIAVIGSLIAGIAVFLIIAIGLPALLNAALM